MIFQYKTLGKTWTKKLTSASNLRKMQCPTHYDACDPKMAMIPRYKDTIRDANSSQRQRKIGQESSEI